jgi:hypothetical protein
MRGPPGHIAEHALTPPVAPAWTELAPLPVGRAQPVAEFGSTSVSPRRGRWRRRPRSRLGPRARPGPQRGIQLIAALIDVDRPGGRAPGSSGPGPMATIAFRITTSCAGGSRQTSIPMRRLLRRHRAACDRATSSDPPVGRGRRRQRSTTGQPRDDSRPSSRHGRRPPGILKPKRRRRYRGAGAADRTRRAPEARDGGRCIIAASLSNAHRELLSLRRRLVHADRHRPPPCRGSRTSCRRAPGRGCSIAERAERARSGELGDRWWWREGWRSAAVGFCRPELDHLFDLRCSRRWPARTGSARRTRV